MMAEDLDVEAMLEAPVDGNKDSGFATANGDSPVREKNGVKGKVEEEDEAMEQDDEDDEDKPVKEERKHKRSGSRERRKSKDRSSRSHKDAKDGKERRSGGGGKDDEKSRRRRKSHSRERDRHDDRKRSRRSSSRGSKHRSSRSPRRRRSRSREERGRERDRERRGDSRDRSRYGRRSRDSPPPRGDRRFGVGRRGGSYGREELPIEERDQRTVFCMQLAARVRQRDIEDFFHKIGRVREVRLIMDNRTRRHKGIAYVEFMDIDSVGKAIAQTGTRLCGVPIVVQHSQAEKNRLAQANALNKSTAASAGGSSGPGSAGSNHGHGGASGGTISSSGRNGGSIAPPTNLYVGSLHFNITEEMLRGIFEPFGRLDKIELSRDPETNRSKGYGFVHFRDAADAKKALEQLNGFELAGRTMKVNYITERTDYGSSHGPGAFDCDEIDRGGIELGAAGRLQLMAKLAEGTGIELPLSAMTNVQFSGAPPVMAMAGPVAPAINGNPPAATAAAIPPPIATQCFLLSNMFDPKTETNPTWPEEIRNDVIEECRKHGGVLHVYVDETSDEGHVYVKCASIASASATVNALHGRWFAGRMITAAFVPVITYHNLFLDAAVVTTPL